jgi:uncharacterized protein
MGSAADIKMDNGRTVKVAQQTRYPWDGDVKMTVTPDQPAAMTINVRIPGWARNQPIASDLYSFADKFTGQPTLKVNGKTVPIQLDKGYVALARTWKAGDTIELDLPMPIRRVAANGRITADSGRVSIERGPVVYAAEWVDNPDGKVRNLMLPDSEPLHAEFKADLLKGVEVIKAKGIALSRDDKDSLIRTPEEITAIPYYAWANRGAGQMMVWFPPRKPMPGPLCRRTSQPTRRYRMTRAAAPMLSRKRTSRPRPAPAVTSTGGPPTFPREPAGWSTLSKNPVRFPNRNCTGLTTPATAAAKCPRPGAFFIRMAMSGSR